LIREYRIPCPAQIIGLLDDLPGGLAANPVQFEVSADALDVCES